jgi:hypothetical protein
LVILPARIAALAVLVTLLTAAMAAGQSDSRQTIQGTGPTEEATGVSSGYRLSIDYFQPGDPNAKPPAVQQIVQELPPGTRLDTAAVPRCAASDQQLMAQGAGACPEATKVGGGVLEADTGTETPLFPRVLVNDVSFFNAPNDQLILFTQSTNTPGPPIRTSGRVTIEGTRLTSMVPPVPTSAPPNQNLAIKKVRVALDARSGPDGTFLTTPETCPASGRWTTKATFTYYDGVSQTVTSETPCTARGGSGGSSGSGGGTTPTARRALMVITRRAARVRTINRRGRIGIALRVDGVVRGVRARLVHVPSGRTVARGRAAERRRDGNLTLRVVRRVTPGRYRVVVTAADGSGRVQATRRVRLRR